MIDKNSSFSIKKWSGNDRPREKLIVKGKNALTDAELVAILIGSGNRDESALALSKRILASVEHKINRLGKLSLKDLMQFKGIGEAKAISIIAGLELGRRRGDGIEVLPVITSSRDAYVLFDRVMGDLEHEEFWVLYLDHGNKVIQQKQISVGGKTVTVVDPRVVFRNALEYGATNIIIGHNHPSGGLKPSTADINLTQKLKQAGVSLDIKVIDHLIIGEKSYFSFADDAML
ncbi:RadC family protein [Aquimarina spongiae]|uniref:DNA repair protein RadC n=1 Tax=Aquimarina spongiae TaxID=570521 RepID=A0A1M6H5R3_9FLAO|nr:DNA repair protein RadC [Aquimarina spongiae]SHJ17516.1 DNA repair protein RadC [Aquimarina spongiae]